MIPAELMKNADCSRLKMLGFSCCHRVTWADQGSGYSKGTSKNLRTKQHSWALWELGEE